MGPGSPNQSKGKTFIPRAEETCPPQLPSPLKPESCGFSSEQGLLGQSVAPASHLQREQEWRLQGRNPDPPFPSPELELKECPSRLADPILKL